MGDRIGVLNSGVLAQVGTPHEIYTNPINTFVARAVGSPAMNLLPGTAQNGRAVMGGIDLALEGPAVERPMIFGIRPEDLVVEAGAAMAAQVGDVENHGVEKIVTLESAGQTLRATVPVTVKVAKGEAVRFGWNPGKVLMFDQASGRSLWHGG